MMGERQTDQPALFYEFSLERHVPGDHLLRSIDRFVDLGDIREHLRPNYSETGRPSIDLELVIRMLLVGYCLGIRSGSRPGRARRCTSISRIAGSAGSAWMAAYRTTRPSRRTGMAASGIATCCASCSRRRSRAASRKVWSVGEGFAVDASHDQGRCQSAALGAGPAKACHPRA